ncbi:MAG: molybdopterin molybdotransferase MoeA [Pseudomonadota bacterium]
MISVAEAWAQVAAHTAPLASERIDIADAAGRVLAETVTAERDQPPFDRVTMDGIAVRYAGQQHFGVAGTQFAGDAPLTLENSDTAIEIMTGAALPAGADTVIPVERYTREGDTVTLEPGYAATTGQFVHRRGSDHVAATTLLDPGLRLGGPETAVLASAGLATVAVSTPPRVHIVATGNELVAAGQPIADHEVRLSNGPAMRVMLAAAGFPGARDHHLPDAPEVLREHLGALLDDADVIVLSGGVSKGKADYVPGVLADLGVTRHFHRVAQRPGKPIWFGTGASGQLVFGLPGNPVSALACCRRYVVPALALASAERTREPKCFALGADWHFAPRLTAFVPVVVEMGTTGPVATPIATNTSGDFTALAGTDGFVELPADREHFAAGEHYPFFSWTERSA